MRRRRASQPSPTLWTHALLGLLAMLASFLLMTAVFTPLGRLDTNRSRAQAPSFTLALGPAMMDVDVDCTPLMSRVRREETPSLLRAIAHARRGAHVFVTGASVSS